MRRLAPFLFIAALVFAACGGDDAAEKSPSADTGSSPAASSETGMTSDDPMMSAMPTDDGSGTGGVVENNMGDPVLNGRIPTNVDGETITVSGYDFANTPAEFASGLFAGSDSLSTWLKEKGKTWSDVSIVTAMTSDVLPEDGKKTAMLTAIRVKGATSDDVFSWWGLSGLAMSEGETKTIAGKKVSYYGIPGLENSPGTYAWSDGDTVFWLINAAPSDFAEKFIAAVK